MTFRGFAGLAAAVLVALLLATQAGLAQFSAGERRQGAAAHPKIIKQYGGVYDDPAVGPYVAGVTARLVAASALPDAAFTVTVLNSPAVNAFALPGGYVYVTRGLLALANTEAELASVIGHEIAHVTLRHGRERQNRAIGATLLGAVLGIAVGNDLVNQIFNIGASGYLASYSREQESEADREGLGYLVRAGYDPEAAPTFLAALGAQSALHAELQGRRYDPNRVDWLASHPATGQRVRETRALARASGVVPGTRRIGRDAHLAAIDGMLYGDDPREGYVRGRKFIHPTLRFSFEVPEGFRLENASAAVTARDGNGNMIRFDSGPRRGAGDMARYITQVWAPEARIGQLEQTRINSVPAATGVTRVKGRDVRLVAYDAGDGETVYRFIIATDPRHTARLAGEMRALVTSFRRLSEAEARDLRPLVVRVHKVRAGESLAVLARRTAWTDAAERRLAVLNGLGVDARLEPGRRIKLVVEGPRPAR